MPKRWLAYACLLFSVAAAYPDGAQAQSEGAPDEAVELYRSGSAHYRAGRYREAIDDLKRALSLDPESPNLVYNVARVSELLGNLSEAIDYYEMYLGLLEPGASDERSKTEETIKRLDGARTQVMAAATASELREPVIVEVEAPPLGHADIWFWATAGLGVAALGTGAVTGVLALRKKNEVASYTLGRDGFIPQRDARVKDTKTLALVTDLLLLGGTAALISAAGLYFFRDPPEEGWVGTEARLQLGPTGAGLELAGRF